MAGKPWIPKPRIAASMRSAIINSLKANTDTFPGLRRRMLQHAGAGTMDEALRRLMQFKQPAFGGGTIVWLQHPSDPARSARIGLFSWRGGKLHNRPAPEQIAFPIAHLLGVEPEPGPAQQGLLGIGPLAGEAGAPVRRRRLR